MRSLAPALIAFALGIVAFGARPASAGGLEFDVLGARSIGRAGAVTVSADGGNALLLNPGGLARRSSLRAQIGIALHDHDGTFRAPDADATGSPVIEDFGRPVTAPLVALQGSVGPLVLGAVYVESGELSRALPSPERNQLPDDITRLFPHRYGGLALGFRRRTLAAGAAMRATSWLGVGISVTFSDVELSEQRHVWAGFADRFDDRPVGNPIRDLRLEIAGNDRFVPGACAGFLVAPPQLPMEIALAASASMRANLEGSATLERTRTDEFPEPVLGAQTSAADLAMPIALRAGLRYLGERWFVEASAEIALYRGRGKSPRWSLDGVSVRHQTGVVGEIAKVPSLVDQRDHAAARLAVDVEVVRGFLWLTAGYALRAAATHREAVTPAYGDLGGHTFAMGAEGQWNAVALTIGYARTISPAKNVEGSSVFLINPFDAGTMTAGDGRYKSARDAFGVALEVAWE